MNKDISELELTIGYSFTNKDLLKTALTHSSFLNESRETGLEDNERFEFFGDAIIEFHVSDYLFHQHEALPEGDLTKMRAAMVCESALAVCAKSIDLGSYIFMGRGEELSGGRERPSVTSDAFEALVAAVYLDGGMEPAGRFIKDHLIAIMDESRPFYDAKTRLQEIIQQDSRNVLTYEMLAEEGPAHDRRFVAAACLNGREIGRGTGHSKKDAQQHAAYQAIKELTGK